LIFKHRSRDPIPSSRRRRRRRSSNVVNRPCNEQQYESLLFVTDWPQTRCTLAKVISIFPFIISL